MLTQLGKCVRNWVAASNPWTNGYGLARTALATGTALTLVFSHSSTLFPPAAGVPIVPLCAGLSEASLFCVATSNHLELARWIAVAILFVVASGWRPRLTGLLHWWVSFSLIASAVTVDGGDQATAVLSLMLIPITLTDSRRWHWQARQKGNPEEVTAVQNRIIEAIRTESPDFYQGFAREMTSGDHLRIQRVLNSAGERVWKVIQADVDRGETFDPAGWFAVDIFVAVETFLVGFLVGFWAHPPPSPGSIAGMSDTPLEQDMITDWVATRLAI